MREGKIFVDGADVDDFSGALGLHQIADHGLGYEKQALQIYVEHEIVVGFGDVPKTGALFDAGVIHEDIEFADLRHGLRK